MGLYGTEREDILFRSLMRFDDNKTNTEYHQPHPLKVLRAFEQLESNNRLNQNQLLCVNPFPERSGGRCGGGGGGSHLKPNEAAAHFSNSSPMHPHWPNESPCRDKNLLGLPSYRQHLHLQLSIVQLGLQ